MLVVPPGVGDSTAPAALVSAASPDAHAGAERILLADAIGRAAPVGAVPAPRENSGEAGR